MQLGDVIICGILRVEAIRSFVNFTVQMNTARSLYGKQLIMPVLKQVGIHVLVYVLAYFIQDVLLFYNYTEQQYLN